MKIKINVGLDGPEDRAVTRSDLQAILRFQVNKENYDIDEARLVEFIGRPLAEDEEVLISPTDSTCSIGKFVIPLERVTKLAVRCEDGMAFPPEAYAIVGDRNDPTTWDVRLWETPEKGVTSAQLTKALTTRKKPKKSPAPTGECHEESDDDDVMKRFINAWKSLHGVLPLPPALTPQEADVSVEKPGIDETDNSFRFRVREPGQFRIMRTISITTGVKAVVGKKGAGAPMVLQSLIFSKTEFPSKKEVANYLKAHPNLKKRAFSADQRRSAASRGQALPDGSFPIANTSDLKNAIRAIGRAKNPASAKAHIRRRARALGATNLLPDSWKFAETPGEELAVMWEEHGYRMLPTNGEPLPAVLHAHFKNVPLARLETATADELSAEGWPVEWTLRLGSVSRSHPFTGWRTIDNPNELEELSFATLSSGPSQLLKMLDAERVIPYEGKDVGSKVFTVSQGTYQPAYAAADRLVVKLSWLEPLLEFTGSGEDMWVVRQVSDATPKLDVVLAELNEGSVNWLLWPKDKRGGGKGHHVVDVAKTVRKRFEYKVCKSAADQRFTLGIAYPANRTDGDAHGDFVTADQLERTAWDYMLRSRSVGLMHQPGTDGAGTVVESYIYRGPDWTLENGKVVKTGDWMMGVVWDENVWPEIKRGAIRGYSLQGWARRGEGA